MEIILALAYIYEISKSRFHGEISGLKSPFCACAMKMVGLAQGIYKG